MAERGDDPEISFDWVERAFGKAHRWWRRRGKEETSCSESAESLQSLETMLGTLARVLAGENLLVRASEAIGGVRGRVVLLPAVIDMAEDLRGNRELYVLRCTIAATQVRLGDAEREPELSPLHGELLAMRSAAHAVRLLREEFETFGLRYDAAVALEAKNRPAVATLRGRAAALEVLRRRALAGDDFCPTEEARRLLALPQRGAPSPSLLLWGGRLSSADSDAARIAAEEDELDGKPADGTEIEAPPKDEIVREVLERDPDTEIAPIHLFEKVETLEDYQGGARRTDGSDDLEDHLDALDEVDLRQIVWGGDDAHSVYRADLEGLAQIPDVNHCLPGERGIPYDEWDAGRGGYRPNWVTVYPTHELPEGNAEWAGERASALAPLRRQLERRIEVHRDARERVTRQNDGDELYLPALIDSYASRRAQRPGSERIYTRRPRTKRDTATTVLLDVSLSADSWVEGQRVLSVTLDAALLLGEVAEHLGDRLQVLAFASNTRNHCRVWTVKDWHHSWTYGRNRLSALSPQGYTRIGPAIRHATAGLREVSEKQRLLLLITDGKPTDFDRYEGRYGIEDVARATREARQDGITVHALGIDPKASAALPTMFGVGGWRVLRHLSQLPEALVEAYGRATVR